MEKAYIPKNYEDTIYKQWEESGYFNPDNLPGDRSEPYAVMMPPPNVTGVLHLGHALENTIMDIGVRYARMQGKKAVLIPGTDHAAVATQAKVEKMLIEEGIKNPRTELGREGLLERIREFAEESKATIIKQVRKMGTSADWSRLAYTFDETRSRAVNEVFVRMYNDGLIYRGDRVVNWSVAGQSTSSADELEHVERTTTLYTFRYAADFPIPIATVLPETKLGDCAVAVHPEDARYKEHIGKTFTVDVGARQPLTIHVIADEHVDPSYGTGALGVTPAHSQADFEIYQKNPEIGMIQVIGQDGKMTSAAGTAYAGLPVKEAREKFVGWLREEGLMIAEEEITHSVAVSDRFKDEIWPLPMEQWFIDVNKVIPEKGKTLKELMREAVTTGHGGEVNRKVNISPKQFEKIYLHWIENLSDWNISRQIWWGHRVPVWYRGEEVYCGVEVPEGEGWIQDEDTLDTWFSSGMWSFSTLGWPEKTADFETFHPTAWMQMGHEILFLWMARMILMSTYALDDIPFREVYIHGILRDKDGKKFSKSAGNGIDPLDVIAEHGTDALRFALIKGITPGADSRFYMEKVEDSRHFVNKLWNITRYVLSQNSSDRSPSVTVEKSIADAWIESRLQTLVKEVSTDLNVYRFSQAAEKLYEFLWSDFADWYIEMSKAAPNPCVARDTLKTVLRLAHPFMPFVTEVLWKELGESTLLLVTPWPTTDETLQDSEAEMRVQQLRGLITSIRNVRAQYRIDPAKVVDVLPIACSEDEKRIMEKLARIQIVAEKPYTVCATVVEGAWTVIIPLDGVIDVEAEKTRIQTEIDEITKYITNLEKKLENPSFVDNAPAEVVEQTRNTIEESKQKLEHLHASQKDLS